eukprot:CAMPEP_0183325476 /NCGR_PEP_ID=MMETSP0160_2-20130417/79657_1 /TAXON_ID=2839 ORGANISM="Odontella Sinensis, Strain Grunow 1884" /NCGR_SAMPLE_ID=MMETSP0160_2 /ASSEMBLY_ACC=CAM_ASM_000250 /LENGTH=46 /DNA_ID= /DNA_START= /DNA_END= /DNA_ORIENTATION=
MKEVKGWVTCVPSLQANTGMSLNSIQNNYLRIISQSRWNPSGRTEG